MARGEMDKAVATLTSVIRQRPNDPEALYRRAQSFAAQRKPQLARADLVKAVQADSADTRARFLLAAIYARSGELLQSIAQMDQILALEPKNLAALEMRGRLYLAQGTFNKAKRSTLKP